MPKKQNKKLRDKKTPKDEPHLNFSISKNLEKEAWSAPPKSLSYREKKEKFNKESGEDNARSGFWDDFNEADKKITEVGEKVISRAANTLRVNNREHKTSPHVVRLLRDEEDSSLDLGEKDKKGKNKDKTAPRSDYRHGETEWVKEVERLRKSTSDAYKSSVKKIYINLLSDDKSKHSRKKKKPSRAKTKISSFNLSRAISLIPDYSLSVFRACVRWIFEFILSIPLGFLLAFEVILKCVEFANRRAIKLARLIGKSTSLVVEHSIFIIIGTLKCLIAVPIKLIILIFISAYKAISFSGFAILYLARAGLELLSNYFKVFKNPPKKFYRKLAAAAVMAVLFILPVKILQSAPYTMRAIEGKVLGATKEGYEAISSVNAQTAPGQIELAQEKFSDARKNLDSLNILVRGIITVLPQGNDGMHAISAGEDLTEAARLISKAISDSRNSDSAENAAGMIKIIRSELRRALPKIESAQEHLSEINPKNLPKEYREKFITARKVLPRARGAISDFNNFSGALLEVLGDNNQKRYAVLFQNNNELRPAGGFIGSFALIDVKDGDIKNIEIPGGGPYDFQGYLTEHVLAPKPLRILSSGWEMQDANWYPDWPTSAEKVAWFLEKSGESSVDGVMALQATTLVKLLKITGPIHFEEYGVTLTSENVLEEIQEQVELKYDKEENQPKKYVAQLAPIVLSRILSSSGNDLINILSLVKSEISRKNILVYFRDNNVNEQFVKRGWEPKIEESRLDYLSVIHANIGGGKTDGVIEETWNQKITIEPDGTAIAELEIVRHHRGDPDHIFEGVNNVDYARVYVPKGSELISFEGVKPPPARLFEKKQDYFRDDPSLLKIEKNPIIQEKSGTRITEEFGKTVFGNWLQVNPGNTLFAKVKYKLPFKIKPYDLFNPDVNNGYSVLIQKQPGARAHHYSISLEYPTEWNISWKKSINNGKVKILGPGLTVFEGELAQDMGFAVVFEE